MKYYWIFGTLLLLAVVATFLRPWHRHFPLERRLWFGFAFVYSSFASAVGSQDGIGHPGILPFAQLIWGVAAFAFFNGCFRPIKADDHPVRARMLDFGLAILCSAIVVGYTLHQGVSTPREVVRRIQCRYNLKDVAIAFHNAAAVQGRFPAASFGDPPHSWRVDLLPYIGQQAVFARYDSAADWGSKMNHPVAAAAIHTYMCPSRARAGPSGQMDDQQRYYSQYVMLTGPHTAGSGARLADFTDGTSNTILVVEACGLNRIWTHPQDADTTSLPAGINLPSPTRNLSPGWISSHHRGGAFVALADGSVQFLSEQMDPQLLKALGTLDQGEPVGAF